MRNLFSAGFALAMAVILMPTTAAAYIGPGAGLGAIGTLFALIGAVFLAVVGLLWYPLKRMIKGKKSSSSSDKPAE